MNIGGLSLCKNNLATMLSIGPVVTPDVPGMLDFLWDNHFTVDEMATDAKHTDWTIHIGVIVRNIVDPMGLITRFECGGRKDAVLRSFDDDQIAVEWGRDKCRKGERCQPIESI
jgi:hypothetical protein